MFRRPLIALCVIPSVLTACSSPSTPTTLGELRGSKEDIIGLQMSSGDLHYYLDGQWSASDDARVYAPGHVPDVNGFWPAANVTYQAEVRQITVVLPPIVRGKSRGPAMDDLKLQVALESNPAEFNQVPFFEPAMGGGSFPGFLTRPDYEPPVAMAPAQGYKLSDYTVDRLVVSAPLNQPVYVVGRAIWKEDPKSALRYLFTDTYYTPKPDKLHDAKLVRTGQGEGTICLPLSERGVNDVINDWQGETFHLTKVTYSATC